MPRHYVLICGSHTTVDVPTVQEMVGTLHMLYGDDLRIMHGDAKCVDRVAGARAEQLGVPVKKFPADWDQHGKAAGPVRNRAMADYLDWCREHGHTVQVVAFRGGPGTEDMVKVAEQRNIPVDRIDA